MNPHATPQPVVAWLRLLRIPAVFTAISNVSVGYFIADAGIQRASIWIGLCLASSSLYLAGMVLNDYFDRELDARERPERPVPSGQISATAAATTGFSLLGVGIAVAAVVGWAAKCASPFPLRPLVIAVVLSATIVVYNSWAKATVFGPLAMGICRSLNILMGVSVTQSPERWQSTAPWVVALGVGLYVMGITWFARDEAEESRRPILLAGLGLMLLGTVLVIILPMTRGFETDLRKVTFTHIWVWPLLVCLFTAGVWRRAVRAVRTTSPRDVQTTIKQALVTLISIDALLALLFAGPYGALFVIALMIPANLLGRVIAVT